jgi:hypothetical protein
MDPGHIEIPKLAFARIILRISHEGGISGISSVDGRNRNAFCAFAFILTHILLSLLLL